MPHPFLARIVLFHFFHFVHLHALPLADDDPHVVKRRENEARAAEWTAAQPQNENTKTWPGVHADKTTRTVAVLAESTGLGAGATIEFPLASLVSNHDYEALALMLGKPSHLAGAVEWLGVPRGQPVSRRAARFWPKGGRLTVTVARLSTPGDAKPLGEWVTGRDADTPAFTNHLVYTGSAWTGGECAADGETPGSVITTFNEFRSLFDIPGRLDKGEAYGRYINAARLEKGEMLVFTFKPEPPRLLEISILAKPAGENTPPANLAQLLFDARKTDKNQEATFNAFSGAVKATLKADNIEANDVTLTHLLDAFTPLIENNDIFTQWTLDDRVTVQAAAQLAAAITAIEGSSGIRVDGPPPGQLYHRAFLPNPDWIPRGERLTQPFELHLSRDAGGAWKHTLVSIDEDWTAPDKITPDLTVNHHPLGDDWETALPKIIAEKDAENLKSALFIFTPPDTPLSAFMSQVRLIQTRLYEVHVFGQAFPE